MEPTKPLDAQNHDPINQDQAQDSVDGDPFNEDHYNVIPEVEIMDTSPREMNDILSDMVVNTNIISASVNGRREIKQLPEPIIYVLEHKNVSSLLNTSTLHGLF